MAAWLKVRIQARVGRPGSLATVEVVALANSGYRGPKPQISVTTAVARALGYWPKPPPGTITREYHQAGGKFLAPLVQDAVEVSVIAGDRTLGPVVAGLLINEAKSYSLMNDRLLSRLKIVLLDPGEGIWAFADELGKPRPSEPEPQG